MAAIEKVGVVGLGTMGAGIAQLCIAGRRRDRRPGDDAELGERARSGIARFLGRGVEKGTLEAEARDAALAQLDHRRPRSATSRTATS